MIKQIFKFFSSALIFLGMWGAPHMLHARLKLTQVTVGVALSPFLLAKLGTPKGRLYSFSTALYTGNWGLLGEYGWEKKVWKGSNRTPKVSTVYQLQGSYLRTGIHYNFLQSTLDHNTAYLGVGGAYSWFGDQMKTHKEDTLRMAGEQQHSTNIDTTQPSLRAKWLEVYAGCSVKVWSRVYVGGMLRYPCFLSIEHASNYVPYSVPGKGGFPFEKQPLKASIYVLFQLIGSAPKKAAASV